MNRADIEGLGLALKQALVDDNEDIGKECAVKLSINFLVDINRIANAVECIALDVLKERELKDKQA